MGIAISSELGLHYLIYLIYLIKFLRRRLLAAIRGDKTITELTEHFDVHANQITQWKNQLLERAVEAFDGGVTTEALVELKKLHAKIGEQALEIDFLEGALTKAGWLSAKR